MGERAEVTAEEGYQVHVDGLKMREHVEAAFILIRTVIREINDIVIGLETGAGETGMIVFCVKFLI